MTVTLPPGWTLARVSDVADVDVGFAFKSRQFVGQGMRLLRGENVAPGTLRWADTRYWAESEAEALRHLLVHPGDLLLAMDRPVISTGLRLARAGISDCPCLLVQRVARVRGYEQTNAYLYFGLSSPSFINHVLVGGQTGTQVPHISGGRIENFELSLAPVQEQHRIVEALESYSTRLEHAAATLQRVERNLERYRASVLKAAVEGRLVPTEAWLAKEEGRDYEPAATLLERVLSERRRRWTESGRRGKYQEPTPPDASKLPELPEGWCWTTVDMLAEVKGGITKGQQRKPGTVLREVPYLRVANVQRGYLDLREVKQIEATQAEIDELSLMPGDVLFNEGGDRDKLGRGWIWSGELGECIHQNHVFRARLLTTDIQPRYLSWYANSTGQQYFIEEGKQTTNLASINMTKLKALPVPLPPRTEQQRIAHEAERLLSVADECTAQVIGDSQRCERLRQAILKWAFEGKLVDQNPADEPPSELLARIQAERASSVSDPAPHIAKNRRTA